MATLYRWVSAGCRGTQLESIRVGGRVFTSTQAIERFIAKTSERETAPEIAIRSPAERNAAIEEAKKYLKSRGY